MPDSNAALREEEELSLSNMNKFKKVEKEYVSSPLPQEEEQNYPNTLAQYRKYVVESSEEEESEELRQKKTFKSKPQKRVKEE